MSMNSALSLSFQNIIYLQYVQQNFMEDQYPINLIYKEKSMPLGSPHLRLLLTGILQEVLL